jgi:hypothetical protein
MKSASVTRNRAAITLLLAVALGTTAAGCVDPGRQVRNLVREANLQDDVVSGSAFRHRVYRQRGRPDRSDVLHVYIEGDGHAFLTPTVVALDPTPHEPIMLQLMMLDPAPSIYLGRPCYFGLARDRNCNPAYWTTRRFAPEVVDSLAAALRSEATRAGASRIELYGHSGGGTLAMLLAGQVTAVRRVITIGPNLDITAWALLHGYSPLLGSLNPMDLSLPPERVQVLHLVGSQDTNTPPAFVEAAAARAGMSGSVRVIRGYTHSCCWQALWNEVLHETP